MDTQPTDKEIANAVRTLAKIGINPYQNANPAQFSNVEQVLTTMGGTNSQNYGMMNLLPYLASMNHSSEGGNYQNADYLKALMMTNMMTGLNDAMFDTEKNTNY